MMTDALLSYDGLDYEYAHKVIDHAEPMLTARSHESPGELLESTEARYQRYVREC